jgi:adenosylhomocysteine nucleosidase
MTTIAIVCAMQEELRALLPVLDEPRRLELGGRVFHAGLMQGRPVVLVRSGIGKVAAAATAALLIQAFEAERLVLTGVAGGLAAGVRVGDVVVARELLQHDMDASPLFPRYEVPLTGRARFESDAELSDALRAAALHCLHHAAERIGEPHLADFGIDSPLVHEGLIVSGDRFVATAAESAALRAALPDALAVEMEGAAFAQVCADFGRPFAVVRTISDRADDSAHTDFSRFIAEVAAVYTREMVQCWLQGGDAT